MHFTFSGESSMGYSTSSEAVSAAGVPVSAQPGRRSVGRFRETRGIKAVRASFGVLCRTAPTLAAHLAYGLLATPPRGAEKDWQAVLREKAQTSRLPLGAGEIAVYEWGAGPTVLMVHGWGARATHLGKMIEPLVAAGFRVVAFDAPAHGDSFGRTTDLVQYAAAVNTVARLAGPVHTLLAHSFGVAMALYARRDWGVETGRQVFISSFDHCKWFTEAFGRHVGLTPAVLARTLHMLEERYSGRLNWNSMSVVDMLRHTPQPTLIIHDRDDAEIPFEHSVALLQAAPQAQFHATSGLGHHKLLGSGEVIAQVLRFVRQPNLASTGQH
jgi:pimeloyl-ACP methyl ester carboxylesterase